MRQITGDGGGIGPVNVTVLDDNSRPPAFSRKREFIPIALLASPATTIMKISVLPARMKEVLAEAQRAWKSMLEWAALARIGVIYVALLPRGRGRTVARSRCRRNKRNSGDRGEIRCHGTIPWSPCEWKSALKIWGLSAAISRRCKSEESFRSARDHGSGKICGRTLRTWHASPIARRSAP